MPITRLYRRFSAGVLFILVLAGIMGSSSPARAQKYPDIRGSFLMVQQGVLTNLTGPVLDSVINVTNTVTILQTNGDFVIHPTNQTNTSWWMFGTLSNNFIVQMSGPGYTPADWGPLLGTNKITNAVGQVYTNGIGVIYQGTGTFSNSASGGTFGGYYLVTNWIFGTFSPVLPPTITAQPVGGTVFAGNAATFTVQATGATNLSYSWFRDSTLLTGQTGGSMTIPSVALSDAGSYTVVVANSLGSVTSTPAILVVNAAPVIKTQPVASLSLGLGTRKTISVSAEGSLPMYYQWYLFDSPISQATNKSLTFKVSPTGGHTNLIYHVHVSNAFGSADSSNCVVTILPDKTPPLVVLSTPRNRARLENVVLGGVATDNGSVETIVYSVSNVVSRTTTPEITVPLLTNDSKVAWSAWPDLLPGSNVVVVTATDLAGNRSKPVTRSFFYRSPEHLELVNEDRGTVKGKSLVAGSTEPVPASGGSNILYLTQGYSLQAVSRRLCVFSNWSVTLDGIETASTNATLNFIMRRGLTIVAHFTAGQFVRPAGTYWGLVTGDGSPEQSGLLQKLALTESGAYSGKVLVGGGTYAISGKFDTNGSSSCSVPRKKGGPLAVDLQLNFDAATIFGSVSSSNWNASAELSAARASATALGPFTGVVENEPGVTAGYMTISSKAASTLINGTLSDGTRLNLTSATLEDGKLPVYANLKNGVFIGWLSLIDFEQPAEIRWVSGTNEMNSTLTVSPWTVPASQTSALPFSTNQPGLLHISDNGQQGLDFQIGVSPKGAIYKLPGSPANSLTGSIDPKTGGFKVTFGTTGNKKVSGAGVILQNQTAGFGLFTTGTNVGTISISTSAQ